MRSMLWFLFLLFLLRFPGQAQPTLRGNEVLFTFGGNADSTVSLVGDFNGWSKAENPMRRDASGVWTATRRIDAGLYQYKYLVDGDEYVLDPLNPASLENYDGSGRNSSFVLTEEGELHLTSTFKPKANPGDEYSVKPGRKPIYLNIIWHQHQPLYVDPETDQLKGPWVRTHATKDYYDMAAMLLKYPDVHCTINLTSSLLLQLQQYYVDRLAPFVNVQENTIDVDRFLTAWRGRTDPWIDLALKETSTFDASDKALIYGNTWNAFGISEVMISRFPGYLRLKKKLVPDRPGSQDLLTVEEMREAKFWFYLAHFDPDFLKGPVTLIDGTICDLSDLVSETADGKFVLKKDATESDCRRMVVEAYKVMSNVVRLHKSMLYDPISRDGQIDVITTPYYHPILPLIFDSELARICQPQDNLPSRFAFPEDARAQVVKAVRFYKELFGQAPSGMWPGEGAVAQPVLSLLFENGISWTASDEKVLKRSLPDSQQNSAPFRFPAGTSKGGDSSLAIVFRDTELSDRIGFKYQTYEPEEAAEDFIQTILSRQPLLNDPDVLLTVILDGENAWEWYRKDNDGKGFLNALYRKLSKLTELELVLTTTVMEYLKGNEDRGIPPHPIQTLTGMEWLYPGSWINANYDTWIGEPEENAAWEALLLARKDLGESGVPRPEPGLGMPEKGTSEWFEYMAWEELYAAEGSDWFWWYGNDQQAPAGDRPFDDAFRIHLQNIYKFTRLAGKSIPAREFPPIIAAEQRSSGQGVMARSIEIRSVVFTCDASREPVDSAVFIAGNLNNLGQWTPNTTRMHDDGTHGDVRAGDGIWSLRIDVPSGTEILYKYTNSGRKGEWNPGEEFPGQNRRFVVPLESVEQVVIRDVFGKMDPK